MNKITLIGTLTEIHDAITFTKDGTEYKYVPTVVTLPDNRKVAANLWNDKIPMLDEFQTGDMVEIEINIASEPNHKQGSGVYYHKINLKSITKYETILHQS